MDRVLSHEKLLVYKRSLEFIEFVEKIFAGQTEKISAVHQLDRASTSIPLNIAEGTGKFTGRDKNRFYDIARGSAAESGACLDVLLKRNKISEIEVNEGKEILIDIVSMLIGLIRSNSDRVYEENENYDSTK